MAKDLFLKKGYRDTTVDDISTKTGLTKGAFYFHFKNKEEILLELVKQVTGSYNDKIIELKKKLKNPHDIMKLLVFEDECCMEEFRDNFDFWIQAMNISRIKKYINKNFINLVDILVDALDPKYGSKKERKQLIVFTLSLSHGLRIRRVLDSKLVEIPRMISLYGSLIKSKYNVNKSTNI